MLGANLGLPGGSQHRGVSRDAAKADELTADEPEGNRIDGGSARSEP